MVAKGIMVAVLASSITALAVMMPVTALAESFFKGKNIRVNIGHLPGGRTDMRVRATTPFLQKYIPGNPTFILGYMPPEVRLANYMALTARRDGTAAGFGSTLVKNPIVMTPGIRHTLDDFVYLGSSEAEATRVLVTRSELGLKTVEQLRAHRGLRIGTPAVASGTFELFRVAAFVLGLRDVRWVTGYSTPETVLALERGEVDAVTAALGTISRQNRHWYKDQRVNFHVLVGAEPTYDAYPELEAPLRGVPWLSDLADTPLKNLLLDLRTAGTVWTWILPNGVPERAVKEFRQGLNSAFKDKNWVAQYTQMVGDFPSVTTGDKLEDQFRKLSGLVKEDPAGIEIYRKLATTTETILHP